MTLSRIQYFFDEVEIIENDLSIIKKLQEKIHTDDLLFEDNNNFDSSEAKKPEKSNVALMEKFMHYYLLLLQHGQQYQQVEGLLHYLLEKFKNKCDIAISARSMKTAFGREIYLNMDEITDVTLFINWFEKHFGENELDEEYGE